MANPFLNRTEAGRALGRKLEHYAERPGTLILALPRGGVPVAFEAAKMLRLPLDVFIVRKLGVPGHEELAFGAIASGGGRVLNDSVVSTFKLSPATIQSVTQKETQELQRREFLFRGDKPPVEVQGKIVLIIDDGLATGASMRAAIQALKLLHPSRIIVAVPIGSSETCEELQSDVDEVVCARTPSPFMAVGFWYNNFTQTSDAEVRALLKQTEEWAPLRASSANLTNQLRSAKL